MCIRWGGNGRKGRGSFGGVNLWRPVVTNGDFVAKLCKSDALFPNYFGEALLFFFFCNLLSQLS